MNRKEYTMTKESEIVRALRHTCDGCNPTPCCEFEALGPEAADLIESLTAENARLRTERDEAQRRARAAVEDMKQFGQCGACAKFYRVDGCGANAHSYCDGGFKWRGPQEAGEESE